MRARFGAAVGQSLPTRDDALAAGLAPALAERLAPLHDGSSLALESDRCRELGVTLVPWSDARFPRDLLSLYRPPVLLCVRGRWPPPSPALAMVGARAASPYGRAVAERMAAAAIRAGHAVVSGLARGIDRAALQTALEEGGPAVAVLGCGIDVAYPRENRRLQDAIARAGTLVSEFPLGYPPDRWTFPRRNRIIAALAGATLVVEASARSGALITAAHALELGRDVLAVPGPIDAPGSVGCNRLIQDGAHPVLDEAGLLQLLGCDRGARGARVVPDDPLLAALQNRARSPDELAAACGLGIAALRGRLIALELEGRVQRQAGDLWVARPSAANRSQR